MFRGVWKICVGLALSASSIVQRRAALAGLKGDFGAHSLRSGFVTEGRRQGVALNPPPLPPMMAMTEHRAVGSVIGYFRAGNAADNPAAHLLDD